MSTHRKPIPKLSPDQLRYFALSDALCDPQRPPSTWRPADLIEHWELAVALDVSIRGATFSAHLGWLELLWEEMMIAEADATACPDCDHHLTDDGVCTHCEAETHWLDLWT